MYAVYVCVCIYIDWYSDIHGMVRYLPMYKLCRVHPAYVTMMMGHDGIG